MKTHEFGKTNGTALLLIHPSLVMWDYFEYVIPLLQNRYHLIIPALCGYDKETEEDFTSIEEISAELADWLIAHDLSDLSCVYGCSMGGSAVIKLLTDRRIAIRTAVIDGGITPYQLPWILTRFIALRDFLMVYLGKLGGLRLLEKAFTSDEYSEEDLAYLADVLKFISAKTIWRTFDSCNNYIMPKDIMTDCPHIEYWYAQTEEKDRKWDIDYVRKHFPAAEFRVFQETGHGGLAVLKPEKFAAEIERAMGKRPEAEA